jgi:magnesium-transporting ATPase (P-type)
MVITQTIKNKSEMKEDLKSLPMPELQAKLGSSPAGLSQAEAKRRLAQYGLNEIAKKKTNPFLKFLTYFWGPIPWMIEVAVVGTQVIATVFAVYGILMTPIGWVWGLAVWGYALAWFMVNDRVKLAAYRIFDPTEPALLSKKRLDSVPQTA